MCSIFTLSVGVRVSVFTHEVAIVAALCKFGEVVLWYFFPEGADGRRLFLTYGAVVLRLLNIGADVMSTFLTYGVVVLSPLFPYGVVVLGLFLTYGVGVVGTLSTYVAVLVSFFSGKRGCDLVTLFLFGGDVRACATQPVRVLTCNVNTCEFAVLL